MVGEEFPVSLEAALVAVRSPSEGAAFLLTLMTPKEISTFRHRWDAIQLASGGATQREIRDALGVSIATATRAAHAARENEKTIITLSERARSVAL